MPKNCQFTPYWPYIKYMLKIEVTTYPKAQSMHGIEVYYSWRIETKGQCPCTSSLYPRNPLRYGRHALAKSAHDFETNSCNLSCAKLNGLLDPAYDGVQLQSICQHMNNIPWFDSP